MAFFLFPASLLQNPNVAIEFVLTATREIDFNNNIPGEFILNLKDRSGFE